MNVQSVSAELATVARKTKGIVPPKLVGASTTVVGDKMYLFGGRLVVERRMLSDLYVFDLQTYTWERLEPVPESVVPGPRYFHSADTWNNHLVIFGGMGYRTSDQAQDSLCVLNDVCFFSIAESRWLSLDEASPSSLSSQSLTPRARYAHLSSVSSDMLFIIGGQDLANGWLDDIHVYDLPSRTWVHRSDYPRHCGTYRSVALSSTLCVRNPGTEPLLPPAQRFRLETAPSVLPITSPDTLVELPYSTTPTPTLPSEIFLYSNYNFTNVKRELEVFTPQPPSSFTITDRSDAMTGQALPPGLRFPTGALLGTSLIIAGTYLAHSYQAFSIWSLDLMSMTWSRIEPGTALATGSWCRAVLWRESNKLLVFGNREGNLVEDYNHRLLSWDHVAYIDLEAFGIYQPPTPGFGLGREAQAMGLAALEDGAFADFEVVCNDGRRIPCSRKLLEDRWPWFLDQRRRYLAAASSALDVSGTNPVLPLPAIPGSPEPTLPRPDPRLTPRSLHLAEPYPVTVAFLQYLYAQTLLTPLQHAPAVLSALMLIASTYDMSHLRDLVKHAMHRALSAGTQGVTGIYDVATICDCQSLRLRAMRLFKKRPTVGRTRAGRQDERHGGSGSSHGRGGSGGHHHQHARPRGMSDANQTQPTSNQGQANGTNGVPHPGSNDQDTTRNSALPRQLSQKSSLGSISHLQTLQEASLPFFETYEKAPLSLRSKSSCGFLDDEDYYDPQLLGLDPAVLPVELFYIPTSGRSSTNSHPPFSHSPADSEDFFGTEPDNSPLSSSFLPPDRPTAYHLPYSLAHRSRCASLSDSPSLADTPPLTHRSNESYSSVDASTTSSAHSSTPATPLSPALAEIVDAVAKMAVTSNKKLFRQLSLQSIDEQSSYDDDGNRPSVDYDDDPNLYNFPVPPQNVPPQQKLLKVKTSLSNISEAQSNRSPDWYQVDSQDFLPQSPGASLSSFDTSSTPFRSISRKSSHDILAFDRRSSLTPVQQFSGGFARLLGSRRSSSTLERDAAKARAKEEKGNQNVRENGDKGVLRIRTVSERGTSAVSLISGLWSPKSPKRQDEKMRKKELKRQLVRDIAEDARFRAETRGFENKVGIAGEHFAVASVGGL